MKLSEIQLKRFCATFHTLPLFYLRTYVLCTYALKNCATVEIHNPPQGVLKVGESRFPGSNQIPGELVAFGHPGFLPQTITPAQNPGYLLFLASEPVVEGLRPTSFCPSKVGGGNSSVRFTIQVFGSAAINANPAAARTWQLTPIATWD